MQIQVKGEMTIAQLRQALFEKLLQLEDELAVQYSKGATLYVNPTDAEGEEVIPINKNGKRINKLLSNGPYRSAAEEFKI